MMGNRTELHPGYTRAALRAVIPTWRAVAETCVLPSISAGTASSRGNSSLLCVVCLLLGLVKWLQTQGQGKENLGTAITTCSLNPELRQLSVPRRGGHCSEPFSGHVWGPKAALLK